MSAQPAGLKDFEAKRVDAGRAEIFARVAGSGPPLLLLHGYPQTHVCWSRIAPRLAETFTVVLADLTGYGDSKGPPVTDDGASHSKRAVAKDMIALMSALGHTRFRIAGHDRGARVAYRLALDHADAVDRLAVLSILPTFAMWQRLADVEKSINTYHWFMLAQKPPIPHDILAGSPGKQVRNTIASWTKSRTLDAFAPEELAAYEAALSRPDVIASICGDYRAGWTTDRKLDEADVAAGRRIACPVLALWGADEYPEAEMRASWSKLAQDVRYRPLDCGHFVTEEAADQTLDALIGFFS